MGYPTAICAVCISFLYSGIDSRVPIFPVHGRDPRLPTVLDLELLIKRSELSLDTYNGELVLELIEAWDSAQKNVQKAQKRAYDRKSKETGFELVKRCSCTCQRGS